MEIVQSAQLHRQLAGTRGLVVKMPQARLGIRQKGIKSDRISMNVASNAAGQAQTDICTNRGSVRLGPVDPVKL